MTLNLTSIKSMVIYVLGLASVIIGAIPAITEPASVHALLVAIGGVVVAVERYLQGQVALGKARAAGTVK